MARIPVSTRARAIGALCITLLLCACGGGGGSSRARRRPTPSSDPLPDPQIRVSHLSPFAAGCEGVAVNGMLYANAEVEPYVAVNPANAANLIGVWQQDRWSNGGAKGALAASSFDGGRTWTPSMAAFSRCSGGNPGNGGDYERASDPWVAIGPDGIAYQSVIAFSGLAGTAGLGERDPCQPLAGWRTQLEQPGHADSRRRRQLQRQAIDHRRSAKGAVTRTRSGIVCSGRITGRRISAARPTPVRRGEPRSRSTIPARRARPSTTRPSC